MPTSTCKGRGWVRVNGTDREKCSGCEDCKNLPRTPTFTLYFITPYGQRIYIDTDVVDQHLTPELRAELDRLSVWGGNTSSNPGQYLMWEFSTDGVNCAKAYDLLLAAGWKRG